MCDCPEVRVDIITRKSSNDFTRRNLRFRTERGDHNSAWGNAPGMKSKNTPSPNGQRREGFYAVVFVVLKALSLIFSFAVRSLIFGSPSGFLSGFGGRYRAAFEPFRL